MGIFIGLSNGNINALKHLALFSPYGFNNGAVIGSLIRCGNSSFVFTDTEYLGKRRIIKNYIFAENKFLRAAALLGNINLDNVCTRFVELAVLILFGKRKALVRA